MSDSKLHATLRRQCVLLIAASIALWSAAALANDPTALDGRMRIAIEATGTQPSAGHCLIRGDSGHGDFIRYLWSKDDGKARWCGLPDRATYLSNGQGVFEVVRVDRVGAVGAPDYMLWSGYGTCLIANPDGSTGYAECGDALHSGAGLWRIDSSVRVGKTVYASIRAKADNRCLIFSNSGNDVRPSLHRWDAVPADTLYCGLGIDALTETGQGLFTFTRVD